MSSDRTGLGTSSTGGAIHFFFKRGIDKAEFWTEFSATLFISAHPGLNLECIYALVDSADGSVSVLMALPFVPTVGVRYAFALPDRSLLREERTTSYYYYIVDSSSFISQRPLHKGSSRSTLLAFQSP